MLSRMCLAGVGCQCQLRPSVKVHRLFILILLQVRCNEQSIVRAALLLWSALFRW